MDPSGRHASGSELDAFFVLLDEKLRITETALAELNRYVAGGFSVFNYIKVGENVVSSMLRDLLDPAGPHGQGGRYLVEFLQLLDLDGVDVDRLQRVAAEEPTWHLPSGRRRRMDLLLDFGAFGMCVENKIGAAEQVDQISDYLTELTARFHSHLLVYLTPDGRPPNTSPDSSDRLVLMSYSAISRWLNACERVSVAEKMRWFLRDLREFIDMTVLPNEDWSVDFARDDRSSGAARHGERPKPRAGLSGIRLIS